MKTVSFEGPEKENLEEAPATFTAESAEYLELLEAISQGYDIGVGKLISENKALLRVRDKWGRSPLHMAARSGHASVCNLLIKKGIPVDSPGNSDNTPLHDAVVAGHFTVVAALIHSKASVSIGNYHLLTPLHLAAAHGHEKIACMLLQAGADPLTLNCRGLLPLDVVNAKGGEMMEITLQSPEDLQPHYRRQIDEAAFRGKWDPSLDFSSRPQPELAAELSFVEPWTVDTITVQWDPPVDMKGYILILYQVHWRCTGAPKSDSGSMAQAPSDQTRLSIKGLKERHVYLIKYRCLTVAGWSPWSATCHRSTQTPPVFLKQPPPRTVLKIGDPLRIDYTVFGVPPPVVRWARRLVGEEAKGVEAGRILTCEAGDQWEVLQERTIEERMADARADKENRFRQSRSPGRKFKTNKDFSRGVTFGDQPKVQETGADLKKPLLFSEIPSSVLLLLPSSSSSSSATCSSRPPPSRSCVLACFASNPAGKVTSDLAALFIRDQDNVMLGMDRMKAWDVPRARTLLYQRVGAAPGFLACTTDPPPVMPLVAGASVEMKLKFHGMPRPEVQWYKDGQRLDCFLHHRRISEGIYYARLMLSFSSVHSSGKYVCVLSNTLGSANSPPVDIQVFRSQEAMEAFNIQTSRTLNAAQSSETALCSRDASLGTFPLERRNVRCRSAATLTRPSQTHREVRFARGTSVRPPLHPSQPGSTSQAFTRSSHAETRDSTRTESQVESEKQRASPLVPSLNLSELQETRRKVRPYSGPTRLQGVHHQDERNVAVGNPTRENPSTSSHSHHMSLSARQNISGFLTDRPRRTTDDVIDGSCGFTSLEDHDAFRPWDHSSIQDSNWDCQNELSQAPSYLYTRGYSGRSGAISARRLRNVRSVQDHFLYQHGQNYRGQLMGWTPKPPVPSDIVDPSRPRKPLSALGICGRSTPRTGKHVHV